MLAPKQQSNLLTMSISSVSSSSLHSAESVLKVELHSDGDLGGV